MSVLRDDLVRSVAAEPSQRPSVESDQTQLMVEVPSTSYFPIPSDGVQRVFWSGFTFYLQLVIF